jgi:Holliday junction resolvasome RuvABC endonuclease subunit
MRVLGIDPGHTRLGLGLVKIVDGEIQFVAHGLIGHPRDEGVKFNVHLNDGIHQATVEFPKALHLLKPNTISAEIVPAGRLGSNSELTVAIITVCKVIAFQFGIPWLEYGANTIKKIVTGNDKATKAAVRRALIALFPAVGELHQAEKERQKKAGEKADGLPFDVTDALAAAYTGAIKIPNETTD